MTTHRRAHRTALALGLLCALTLGACSDERSVSEPRPSIRNVKASRGISVSDDAIALLSVEVSGGELKQSLLYDFRLDNPEIIQSLAMPAGKAYSLTVRGYDRYGELTHQGNVFLEGVEVGANRGIELGLDPVAKGDFAKVALDLIGEEPAKGDFRIVIRPDRKAVYDGESVNLRAYVVDGTGAQLPIDPSEIHWALLDKRTGRIDPFMSKDMAQATYAARLTESNFATLIAEWRQFRKDWYEQVFGDPWVDVSAGEAVTCAVRQSGKVYCWGYNYWSALGINNNMKDSVCSGSRCTSAPLLVQTTVKFASVSVGETHVCALEQTTGAAYCWGNDNISPKLGLGSNFNVKPAPTLVNGGLAFKSISAGWDHTCAVTTAGAAYCWGSGYNGRLGNMSASAQNVPTLVSTPSGLMTAPTYTTITAGMVGSCAFTTTSQIFCWGQHSSSLSSSIPVEVPQQAGSAWASMSPGGLAQHVCATNAANNTYCWGDGASGQLGNNTYGAGVKSSTPVGVMGGSFVSVTAGYIHSCGLTSTGAAYCWGENVNGALGDGTAIARKTPVAAGYLTYSKISAGASHTCGIDLSDNKNIYCWGANTWGQVGMGRRDTWALQNYANGVVNPTKVVAPIP